MRRVDFIVGTRDFKTLKAEQFMQDNAFYSYPENSGESIAQVLTEHGFGSVPVVDGDHRLIGIVSEVDLLKVLKEDKLLSEVTAGQIMTPNPMSVSPEISAMDIINLLQNKHLIRLPVVDEKGKLVGIVARRDILQGYLSATRPTKVF